ncbi:MAG: hypothetical protein WAN71_19215 [Mycobacterium sp.]|uniref:hypothetical protein n=1 Tax=Mycobacterium sp. TaxID=1785 RepID=UPI003BB1B32E
MTLVLGTAAGAFLAAGLIPLATSPVAHADPDDVSVGADTDFDSAKDPLLALFGVTDVGVADPSDNFEAMVVTFPSLPGVMDVLTSGTDPSDALTTLGVPADIAGGMTGVTVNTFIDPSLGIDSSFTIPFTDPLAGLWDILVANDFFGL